MRRFFPQKPPQQRAANRRAEGGSDHRTDDWSWMSLLTNEKIHADGWIEDFGQTGNHLYVNRGIGFSNFPVRINGRPKLTFITLRGKNR